LLGYLKEQMAMQHGKVMIHEPHTVQGKLGYLTLTDVKRFSSRLFILPRFSRYKQFFLQRLLHPIFLKLPSTDDRGKTEHVTTPMHPGLVAHRRRRHNGNNRCAQKCQ